MCWANQRLDAPAISASQQTSSISAVDEKPSKNTPTAIKHSLQWVATRAVVAESADVVTGTAGFRHAPRHAIRETPLRDRDGYSATSRPTAARQRATEIRDRSVAAGKWTNHHRTPPSRDGNFPRASGRARGR